MSVARLSRFSEAQTIARVFLTGIISLLVGCTHAGQRNRNPLVTQLQVVERNQASVRSGATSSERRKEAEMELDRAIARAVSMLRERITPMGSSALTNGGLRLGPYLLHMPAHLRADAVEDIGFCQYDHLYPADPAQESGFMREFARIGKGAAMVGELGLASNWAPRRDQFYGQRLYLPVTALLEFQDAPLQSPRPVQLRLIDPMLETNPNISPSDESISANYTAAARLGLEREAFIKLRWLGLLWPGIHMDNSGLYLLQPYDPDKIPVVMIHGLYSSPATWLEMASAIMADAELSRRFQLWYFVYPTGLPIPDSACRLRTALKQAIERLDATHSRPTTSEMVLVGHSMGGLLARLQAINSGDCFWTNHFSKPADELLVSEKTRLELKSSFFFDRQSFVSRLIFIATPHAGSDLADLWLSRLFVRLIHLPATTIQSVTELLTLNADALRPDLLRYQRLGCTSVESLSPGNPLYRALAECPVPVPCHSIIANREGSKHALVSDGVVPYSSAHLAQAESEKVVAAGHPCTDSPAVVEEVKRILRLHIREFDRRHPRIAGTAGQLIESPQ